MRPAIGFINAPNTMALKATIYKAALALSDMDRSIYADHNETIAPALWHKDYTEQILHWIDVGQPDDKRLMKAAGRAERVSVYSFASSTNVWWKNIESKLTRASNLVVWQIDAAQSQALAKLAERSMQLQVTVQDGTVWMSTALGSVEITPVRLTAGG